jgi:hypothetical protein
MIQRAFDLFVLLFGYFLVPYKLFDRRAFCCSAVNTRYTFAYLLLFGLLACLNRYDIWLNLPPASVHQWRWWPVPILWHETIGSRKVIPIGALVST